VPDLDQVFLHVLPVTGNLASSCFNGHSDAAAGHLPWGSEAIKFLKCHFKSNFERQCKLKMPTVRASWKIENRA